MVNFIMFFLKSKMKSMLIDMTLSVQFTNAILLPVITQSTNQFIHLISTYQASTEASQCALVLEM